MSLGFDAIAALPFATSGPDNSVNVSVSKNADQNVNDRRPHLGLPSWFKK